LNTVEQAARLLVESRWTIALTGAGISVDSGIPDFRSPGGLWDRFDPFEYAHIDAFLHDPEKVWTMLREMHDVIHGAKPNAGHFALAELEQLGILKAIITQNIDSLHQLAGSQEVIEFHGNSRKLVCLECGAKYNAEKVHERTKEKGVWPPVCDHDGRVLKPDVVLFGEPIPVEASVLAQRQARECDVILVIGTSAMVFPASGIPMLARQTGATVIEVNRTSTALTDSVAHISLHGSSTEILPRIVEHVRRMRA